MPKISESWVLMFRFLADYGENISLVVSDFSNYNVQFSLRANVAKLVDALDLGSSGYPWEFESPHSHH